MNRGFSKDSLDNPNKSKKFFYRKLMEKAFFAQKNKNLEEAINIYQELYSLNIKNPIIYFNYGLLLETTNNFKKANEIYLKAIKKFPNNPNFYNKLALLRKNQNKYKEAEKLFFKAIEIDKNFENGYINLGNLYSDLKNNKKAEEIYRQVLRINSNSELVNLNLGTILVDKGELEEAKKLFLKTIKINPQSANAFFSLSKFKEIKNNEAFKKNLFNEKLLKKQNELAKANIFFARSNVNHLEKNFNDSKKNLILANTIKLKIFQSDAEKRINFTNYVYKNNSNINFINDCYLQKKNHLFIVGMPRSGSTLVESIISQNSNVFDLGETEALPYSYKKWLQNKKKEALLDIYNEEIKVNLINNQIITDKNLSNYSLVPIILEQIKGSKIIYCYRNPLDNILSIYRANFIGGYSYSSSLIDTSKVLLNAQKIMHIYKKLFPKNIYSVNYDSLVTNPESEIPKLIEWLNFEWDKKYLAPHLNRRSVYTTSKIQVRYPINNKSLLGWKNYRDLLLPVIDFFKKHEFDSSLSNLKGS
tara:strand:- start:95 stop:1687 length:1593 start_codon:yes stop_codon:yes gene_type:complete